MYVPVLKTLQTLLKNETVLSEVNQKLYIDWSSSSTLQVERGHQCTSSGKLSDFCDGSYYQSHQFYVTHKNALQIFFYYDDIEVCNPLGSHTKKHKLGNHMLQNCSYNLVYNPNVHMYIGVFYFVLGNLQPKYRSKLKAIQLVALCKTSYVKKYSLNQVLEPIIQDLTHLVRHNNYTWWCLYIIVLSLHAGSGFHLWSLWTLQRVIGIGFSRQSSKQCIRWIQRKL